MAQRGIRPSARAWVRYSPQAVGFLSVALGVIGIFLPALPITPFLLLAAACSMRSLSRFHHWLVSHPRLGPWIRDYLDGEDTLLKSEVHVVGLMWASIALSCYLVRRLWTQGFMLTSVVLVGIYILRQKTRPPHDV